MSNANYEVFDFNSGNCLADFATLDEAKSWIIEQLDYEHLDYIAIFYWEDGSIKQDWQLEDLYALFRE